MENDRLLIVSFKYTYYFHGAFFYYIFFTIKDTPINSCMLFSNMITYTSSYCPFIVLLKILNVLELYYYFIIKITICK